MDEKKLKTMNEIPVEWLRQLLQLVGDLASLGDELGTKINEFELPSLLRGGGISFGEAEVLLRRFKADLIKAGQELIEMVDRIPPNVPSIPDKVMRNNLTARQYQIIKMRMDGKEPKEIAFELGINAKTVWSQEKPAIKVLEALGYSVVIPKKLTASTENLS